MHTKIYSMSTPLANKTTFSSRMKMAALTTTKPKSNINNNNVHATAQPKTNRLGGFAAPTVVTTQRIAPSTFGFSRSSSKVSSTSSAANPRVSNTNNGPVTIARNSSTFTLTSRQNSLASSTSVHAATVRKSTIPSAKSSYVPDTNTVRKGLAKFSNPVECQRQFQALSSEIRQLNETNANKDKVITRLRGQLDDALKQGVGYATIVQYFARKLKIDSDELDLESECQRLKVRVEQLLKNEAAYESRLEAAIEKYRNRLQLEQDLKENLKRELEETKAAHLSELMRVQETHTNELIDLVAQHSALKQELENRITSLEQELDMRAKELTDLRKEHEVLSDNYNKLEDSLTRDKNARVKYAQEKANQLQKEVDSLNSVLEMRTERMHALEKDSILLSDAQQELMIMKDNNKALKQQLESMNAVLNIKREKYENLMAEKERLVQYLKRERKERRRMTMRFEQLEYALNETFTNDNNITLSDESVDS